MNDLEDPITLDGVISNRCARCRKVHCMKRKAKKKQLVTE